LYSEAPSNGHRLNIYSKYDELCLNNDTNRKLWKYINKEDFQNSLRFEASFDNPEIIRKYFNINQKEDIMLTTILNKAGNILYNYCCNMISNLKIPKKTAELLEQDISPNELAKRLGMREIIHTCGYNRSNIKCFLKSKLKGKKNPSYYMKEYDDELNSMKFEKFGGVIKRKNNRRIKK